MSSETIIDTEVTSRDLLTIATALIETAARIDNGELQKHVGALGVWVEEGVFKLSGNLVVNFKPDKRCPNCHNYDLVHISTQNEKRCTDCNTTIEWKKEEGQKPYV